MKLLFLAHRIPYPPNKGDKIRSFHVLRHLSERHEVWLGGFYDDPRDKEYITALEEMVKEARFFHMDRRRLLFRGVTALLRGRPVTLEAFGDGRLSAWVHEISRRQHIDAVFVFSSSMGQYAEPFMNGRCKVVVDLVDVDSEKWFEYASRSRVSMFMKPIYTREGRLLRKYELALVDRADAALLVSEEERELFVKIANESGLELENKVHGIRNGVDFSYFDPRREYPNPYTGAGPHLVFTGAMDYWANVDGVEWFVQEIFPRIRKRHASATFHIVGSNPDDRVWALAGDSVDVTGYVEDVRPYLRHADISVCPLRIARGIQNKVIEAMSMGVPVVATPEALTGIGCPELDRLAGKDARTLADNILMILNDGDKRHLVSEAAYLHVRQQFGWDKSLQQLDGIIEA